VRAVPERHRRTAMTERLYYTDAYLTAFDAKVVDRGDGSRRLYLDRTAFYPTSGGQPHDLGTLGGIPVADVIDEESRIAHILAEPTTAETVHGELDWPRRFDYMQQHTGQHLLSAVFADDFNHSTLSVHFGPESSTLDLDCEAVDDEVIQRAEQRANQVIAENRPVTITFEDAGTALGLRKMTARDGIIRVVSIAGADRSACGGTHVRTTGEIGVVLLRRQERIRRTARLEFVCGMRAARRARGDFEALSRISQGLSAGIDDAPGLVQLQSEQLHDLQGRVRKLESDLHVYRARERYDATPPDATGLRRVMERSPHGSPDEWRAFALAYCSLPRAVFIACSDSPPSVLLATSADAGLDAGRELKSALSAVGGRGGGSPRMAQGSVPSASLLEPVLRALSLTPNA
jgi:alanyl-tRNA synthetase